MRVTQKSVDTSSLQVLHAQVIDHLELLLRADTKKNLGIPRTFFGNTKNFFLGIPKKFLGYQKLLEMPKTFWVDTNKILGDTKFFLVIQKLLGIQEENVDPNPKTSRKLQHKNMF